MKNLGRRTLSLVLSGVLLLGSVPMGAFATEQIQEPAELVEEIQSTETTSVQTQPTEIQPAIEPVAQVITDDVADVETGDQPKVLINDEEIEDGASLYEGTVSYSAERNELILNQAASVTKISVEGKSLTIKLIGANEIQSDGEIAITAEKDLTITGEGSLKIVTDNAVAISVAGVADGDNQKGLIIDGAQVSVKTDFVKTETENPVGIVSENGVAIQGAAHFRTSHSRSGDPYVMECNGYLNGEVYTEKRVCDGGSALEFIGGEHVGEWVEGDNEHYKTCADSSCALYENTEVGNHPIDNTSKYESLSNTKHRVMYNCCNKVKEGLGSENHDLRYYTTDFAIQVECTDCKVTGSLTLTANDREVGSEAPEEDYTAEGILMGAEPDITYTDATGDAVTPETLGEYTVTMSYGGQTVTKKIKITKINLSNATVTVGGIYTYEGTAHEPENITVTRNGKTLVNGTDYTVSFSNNINAGTASVTVKAAENSDYMGETTGTFTIQKKQLVTGDVTLGTALTYNGAEQTQTVVKTAEDSDVTFDVKDNKQTNAGENYELTVEGTGNYTGEVKLTYSIAKSSAYADTTKKNQIVGEGIGTFDLPEFTGIGGENVTGTCAYRWNEETVTEANIPTKVNSLQDGQEATLHYVFTPAANGNYTDEGKTEEEKSGSIQIRKVELTFGRSIDEEHTFEAFTANDLKQPDPITYGDEKVEGKGIVDVSKLVAKANGVKSQTPGEGFCVKYAKVTNSGPEEIKTDAPDAGSNRFFVYYSGTLGEYTFNEVEVCHADIRVDPKTLGEDDITVPVNDVLHANADGSALALLKDTNKGQMKDGGSLEYSLSEGGTYTMTVPATTEVGYREVWYRTNANYTPQIKGRVQILVVPYLTATYGQTLDDIKNRLPDGFTFHAAAHPKLDVTVGNAGERTVKLDYEHPQDDPEKADDYPTLTDYNATLKVSPKSIKPTVTLNTAVYDKDDDGYIHYDDRTKSNLFVVKDGETALTYKTDYEITPYLVLSGLKAAHTIANKTGGNYVFETVRMEVNLYRPEHSTLTGDNFPKDNLEGTEYDTLEKAKAALSKELKEDAYPESLMKYVKVYMTKTQNNKDWEENTSADACPPSGFTYVIPYEDLLKATENDDFKVAALYFTEENTSTEMARTGGGAVGDVEVLGDADVVPTANGLKVTLDRAALVCVARKVDLTKEYDIAKSIVLDGKSSTKGSLSFKIGTSTVTKATYGKTVEVTAKANSGYSIEKVTFTAESGETVNSEKVSEGNYKFTMPASKVTVKLSLKKTASTSKNPYSGDNSKIYLWVTILAASGAAIGALMVFWFKKRKK